MLTRAFEHEHLHIRLLLVLCLLLFFPLLAARDFWEQENQYAEVVRIMMLDGNYLVPKVNGTFFPESPPLYFWVAAIFSWVAGGVGELPLRLPSAVSATELIVVFYCFVRKRFDARLAIVSSVVLATSVLTVHVARHIPVNMLFYLFITVALFLLMELLVFDSERASHAYGAWLCMALACLTNGPVGILLPAVVVFIYLACSRCWQRIGSLRLVSGASLFLLLTVPWFAYLAWIGVDDWRQAILVHLRFTGHRGPDHQVFFSFPLAFTPWCFLFIPMAISLWRKKFKFREKPILFLFVWFAVGLFLSEVSFGHHNHYLFLAYVPVALGVGYYLCKLAAVEADNRIYVWTHYSVLFVCGLFVLGGLSGPVIIWRWWPFLAKPAAALGVVFVGTSVALLCAWRGRSILVLIAGFSAYPLAANLLLQFHLFPALNAINVRPIAERVGAEIYAHPGSEVAIHSSRLFSDFNYYSKIRRFEATLGSTAAVRFLEEEKPRFLLLRNKYVEAVREQIKTPLEVILQSRVGLDTWVLLSRCKVACDPTPSARLRSEIVPPVSAVSGGSHDRGTPARRQ